MNNNEEQLDPLNKLRNQISQKQPSEKPADDVLNDEKSEAVAESQFVQTTREELGDENSQEASPAGSAGATVFQQDRHMPDTERVTEND